ncbi:protein Lines homolog 1 [Diretmus argenteus]
MSTRRLILIGVDGADIADGYQTSAMDDGIVHRTNPTSQCYSICLLRGSRPRQTAGDLAYVVLSGVSGLSAVQEKDAELTYLSLTVVEKLTSSLLLPPRGSPEGTISAVWHQKCVQVFRNSFPGNELDACMWLFTDVLKKLLKGSDREILRKLLAAFDPDVCALCSKFLPEETKEASQSAADFTNIGHWPTSFSIFLNLLEVLTASRLICQTGVCLQSQRLTHTHASALLRIIASSAEYFLKKRVLLLLKKTQLQKAGEDMALGEVAAGELRDEHFSADMTTLADAVLQAVSADWLQRVQVEATASFFGGSSHVRGDGGQKPDGGQTPDYVMLRAVSLVVLKSLELNIKSAGGTGVDRACEVHGYLQALAVFLRQRGVPLVEASHRCRWFSLLFGEQDDDMMEAATAFLSIFLYHRSPSGLHDVTASDAACASGYNPHCHFLLLLQSVSFDHSILLDFLISAETCFLEYFVRYLKHLRADREGFTLACRRMEASDRHHRAQQSLPAAHRSSAVQSRLGPDLVQPSFCDQPTAFTAPVDGANLAVTLRLVDYGSSEESETEDMAVSEDIGEGPMGPRPSVSEEDRLRGLDAIQGTSGLPVSIVQTECEPAAGTQTGPSFTRKRRTSGLYSAEAQSEQTSCLTVPTPSGQTAHPDSETFTRAVLCLSELREVVARLQMKNLFPYNPSSLLKLLAQVDMAN